MKFFAFTGDIHQAREFDRAKLDGVIVDWEIRGKLARQEGQGFEINSDPPEVLSQFAQEISIPIIVRINPLDHQSPTEIDLALKLGANAIMLPMAKSANEVETFLKLLDGRAASLIQIETRELVEDVDHLGDLNWTHAHIGFNDMMISYGHQSLWQVITDGTVERICNRLSGRSLGFAAGTCIGCGHPLRVELLMHEMTRLNASFCFLRRSFKRDVRGRNLTSEVDLLRSFAIASAERHPDAKQLDHLRLVRAIEELSLAT